MIDLYCHLLPGVDDGPDTLAEALELCRSAVASQFMPQAVVV